MKLVFEPMPGWPLLAWLAKCDPRSGDVVIHCGPWVERREDWFSEAVWAGDFGNGDFDRTDIVAGTGGRIRDGRLFFVSSGSTIDRLQWLQSPDGGVWLSNALSCLLSAAGGTVDAVAGGYDRTLGEVVGGKSKGQASPLVSSAGAVRFVYFDNVVWDGAELRVVPKPGGPERFDDFLAYREFLDSRLATLVRNARDPGRARPYDLLGTISSGYDSATCAALAKPHGLKEVISFAIAKKNLDDSGEPIARHLGLQCTMFGRDAWRGVPRAEPLFVTGDGVGMDILFAGATSHRSGRVLLTGYHGDKMWSKDSPPPGTDIVRGDRSGLSLTEFRLRAGFINCPIPFWGARQIEDVHRISVSEEMRPWDVPGPYSRPICRRILEESGVPRDLFGIRKKAAAQGVRSQKIFMSPSARGDYLAWFKAQRSGFVNAGRKPPISSPPLDRIYMEAAYFLAPASAKVLTVVDGRRFVWRMASSAFLQRLTRLTEPRPEGKLGRLLLRWRYHVFPWALERAKADVPAPVNTHRAG